MEGLRRASQHRCVRPESPIATNVTHRLSTYLGLSRIVGDVRDRLRDQLGGRLRDLRAERGWSQEKLAEAAGLHRTYVSSVERSERNISIDNIERLAMAFSVEPADLFRAPGQAVSG